MAMPANPNSKPQMDWTVPEGWRQVPGTKAMRIATFETGDGENRIEIVVSAFPGQAGGLLANVNRWRGQLHIEPLVEADLQGHLVPFPNGPVQGFTLDMTGEEPDTEGEPRQRIVGAIINGGTGMTWFVKAMDQPEKLDSHKDAIVQFSQSFRAAQHDHNHDHDHTSQQPAQGQQTGTTAAHNAMWQRPSHWHPDPNPSSILSAAFNIEGTGSDPARVTVTVLKGTGGGALPNVNRWRGQLDLPPVNQLSDQPTSPIGNRAGQELSVIDLVAADGHQRMLVVMLPLQDRVWYYKMTGINEVVEKEKQAFEQFVLKNSPHQGHP